MLKRVAVALSLACVLAGGAAAQQRLMKSWREWSKKDVQKILEDSAWAQTQVETDTSEMFFTPTTQGQARPAADSRAAVTAGGTSTGNNRAEEGALNQATSVKFHIRWLSARPVRQAIARQVELRHGTLPDGVRAFAEGPMDTRVVIAVTFESSDQRLGGKVMQAFNSAVTGTLKNSTYLERKDGKRIFLQEYIPPTGNALGMAMFVFPRYVGEQPLLTAETGEVRFFTEFSQTLKLNMKYKVSDMIYRGQLEY